MGLHPLLKTIASLTGTWIAVATWAGTAAAVPLAANGDVRQVNQPNPLYSKLATDSEPMIAVDQPIADRFAGLERVEAIARGALKLEADPLPELTQTLPDAAATPAGQRVTIGPSIQPVLRANQPLAFEITPPAAAESAPPAPFRIAPPHPSLKQPATAIGYPLPQIVPITSRFGWRTHPITGDRRFHAGIDLGAAHGTPVLASLSGWVIAAGDRGDGYGLQVLIQSGHQIQTRYAHLAAMHVTPGQWIRQGQILGQVGSTGLATGPHLHLEMHLLTHQGWQAVDFLPHLFLAQIKRQTPAIGPPARQEIRVGLGQRKTFTLSMTPPTWIVDAQGRILASLAGGQTISATVNDQGFHLGDRVFPSGIFLQPASGGLIAIGDRRYRGRIQLIRNHQHLLAVNWVPLEDYLHSVVGAEVYSHWPLETLKAQAIAARSYALHYRLRPAHRYYDLDNTTRFQAYRGVASEHPRIRQAVAATRGRVLVPSQQPDRPYYAMYAADDALTDYHRQAYGKASMSQWGAAQLGWQGYDHRSILATYYPGAMLANW